MNPFSHLAPLTYQLRPDCVRDLAWALTSPPLLSAAPWYQRHPLQGSDWARAPAALEAWLRQLSAEPAPLLAFLAQSSVRRLGLYYERLWQFALAAAPGVTLLAANLPVRDGGRTLGEFDLLLRDAEGEHHLELALKYYLGPPAGGGHSPAQWLGPGAHDRLDRKLAHLGEQQLRLAEHPGAAAILAEVGARHTRPSLWLGGYLFYPWPQGCTGPAGAHPAHGRGAWLHRQACPALAQSLPGARWAALPRARWLAPAAAQPGLSGEQMYLALLALEPMMQAQMVVRLGEDGSECERLFVVPDAWPDLPRRY
ncbi:DUF1853 family protein [Pseudomonas sp. NPDC007930]|uniref:DUF1853 family protein n=1 Tax=Pseudomonas sp. NPDC007930 TaxID=3364417 RepID=UPI0036F150E7